MSDVFFFFFFHVEKMQANLLYWFALQQQTSKFKKQKFCVFYVKFSVDYHDLGSLCCKKREVEKMIATKVHRKNANWHNLMTKDQLMHQDLVRSPKIELFRHFLFINQFLTQKH